MVSAGIFWYMANLTLGQTQINVLTALKSNATGLTAPDVRDFAVEGEGDYGTRRAHAVLKRLVDRGYIVKEEMSEKVALNNIHEETGRKSKYRFKITPEGKKALKAA